MTKVLDLVLSDPRALAALILVALSFLPYVLGSNVAWLVRRLSRSSASARADLLPPPLSLGPAYEVARLVYYLGLPFIALYVGILDARALGLAFFDWPDGTRWSIVLFLAAWTILMFIWVPYLRATYHVPAPAEQARLTWGRRIVEIIYIQAHWALYRAAAIVIFSATQNELNALYWGTAAGLCLSLFEGWSDPRVRHALTRVGQADLPLWFAGQAIVNAIAFAVTRNIWLLVLIHLALELTVPHLHRLPELKRAAEPTPRYTVNRPVRGS